MILTLIIISWVIVGVLSCILYDKIEKKDVFFSDIFYSALAGYVLFVFLILSLISDKIKLNDKPIIKFKK